MTVLLDELLELEQKLLKLEESSANNNLKKSINSFIQEITDSDRCPRCGSNNVANEGPPNEYEEIEVTCHSCSAQWTHEL